MSLAPAHAELRHSVETVETIDPASLPPRVSVLTLPGPSGTQHQVFLLGTAHISEVGTSLYSSTDSASLLSYPPRLSLKCWADGSSWRYLADASLHAGPAVCAHAHVPWCRTARTMSGSSSGQSNPRYDAGRPFDNSMWSAASTCTLPYGQSIQGRPGADAVGRGRW